LGGGGGGRPRGPRSAQARAARDPPRPRRRPARAPLPCAPSWCGEADSRAWRPPRTRSARATPRRSSSQRAPALAEQLVAQEGARLRRARDAELDLRPLAPHAQREAEEGTPPALEGDDRPEPLDALGRGRELERDAALDLAHALDLAEQTLSQLAAPRTQLAGAEPAGDGLGSRLRLAHAGLLAADSARRIAL